MSSLGYQQWLQVLLLGCGGTAAEELGQGTWLSLGRHGLQCLFLAGWKLLLPATREKREVGSCRVSRGRVGV